MDRGAKATGLLVFVTGIILMVMVFSSALHMLGSTNAAALDIKRLPQEGIALLARIGFLFLLGYIGSTVAGRGVNMFEAAGRKPEDASATSKKAES